MSEGYREPAAPSNLHEAVILMIFNNYEAVFYTILALVPGFIMNMGYGYLIPLREGQAQLYLIRLVVFSCVNYALVWPAVHNLIQIKYWVEHPLNWSFILILILLLMPYSIGMFVGYVNSRDWIRTILRKIGINPIHPAPTAWDFIMPSDAKYVIVTLKDKTEIFGLYSDNSLASSVPTEKDIYIEQVFKIDERDDETWLEVEGSRGMWINGSEILHIEFKDAYSKEDEENGESKQPN